MAYYVVEGIASIDQHALTGESQPLEKAIGDKVFAATVVMTGRIYMKVEKSGENTTIAKIGQILNNSINVKSNIQLKGEEWANKATLPMLGMAGLIFPILGPVNTVVFFYFNICVFY
jgi:Cu2+-exporting ATPase